MINQSVNLSSPTVTYNYFMKIWDRQSIARYESVYALFLDDHKNLIDCKQMATGDTYSCNINMHYFLRTAIKYNARFIIMGHNHPTGTPNPSIADIEATEELYIRCACVGVSLLDHFILSPEYAWLSMRMMGLFGRFADTYETIVNVRNHRNSESIFA